MNQHDLRPGVLRLLTTPFENLPADRRCFRRRGCLRDAGLEAAESEHPPRLRDLAQVVGRPERDVVLPRDERKALRHDADHGPRLAVHANRGSDHVRRSAEAPLPRVVADDDRASLLLLDDVVEVLGPVGAPDERGDTNDREPVHVHRHLFDADRFAGSQERDRRAVGLKQAERLERAAPRQKRLHDFEGRRLLVDAFRCVGVPQHGQAIGPGEAELVGGHLVHHAVHRGGRANTEPERHSRHGDETGVTPPQTQRVTDVGKLQHDPSCPRGPAAAATGRFARLYGRGRSRFRSRPCTCVPS
jgi:hypothetical protein